MKLLGIYDHSGPKYHRILLPITMMDRLQYSMATELTEENSNGVDVVFFNRMIQRSTVNKLINLREKNGFKLICDLDDHWRLDSDHFLYDDYKQFNTDITIENCIKICDAITVTHDRLRDEVFKINKNVHVLPNAISKSGQFNIEKIPCEKIRLFWAGSVTHRKDLELLKRPLALIDKKKVKLVLGGRVPGHDEWVKMIDAFTNKGWWDSMILSTMQVYEYYKMYAHCDIALIPLVDNRFNKHKSNLKVLEAANIGAPVIVSKVHPYLDFPDDLVNYVDAHTPWYYQLNEVINNYEYYKEQGNELREYCDKVYNFESINKHRREVLESVKH